MHKLGIGIFLDYKEINGNRNSVHHKKKWWPSSPIHYFDQDRALKFAANSIRACQVREELRNEIPEVSIHWKKIYCHIAYSSNICTELWQPKHESYVSPKSIKGNQLPLASRKYLGLWASWWIWPAPISKWWRLGRCLRVCPNSE